MSCTWDKFVTHLMIDMELDRVQIVREFGEKSWVAQSIFQPVFQLHHYRVFGFGKGEEKEIKDEFIRKAVDSLFPSSLFPLKDSYVKGKKVITWDIYTNELEVEELGFLSPNFNSREGFVLLSEVHDEQLFSDTFGDVDLNDFEVVSPIDPIFPLEDVLYYCTLAKDLCGINAVVDGKLKILTRLQNNKLFDSIRTNIQEIVRSQLQQHKVLHRLDFDLSSFIVLVDKQHKFMIYVRPLKFQQTKRKDKLDKDDFERLQKELDSIVIHR